jgi:hypothetical protein
VHYAGHLGVRATAVGEGAKLIELTFIGIFGEQVILGFLLIQGFKPDAMVLALFTILPAQYLALFNRNFLRYKLEVLNYHQIFISTSEQAVIKNRQY